MTVIGFSIKYNIWRFTGCIIYYTSLIFMNVIIHPVWEIRITMKQYAGLTLQIFKYYWRLNNANSQNIANPVYLLSSILIHNLFSHLINIHELIYIIIHSSIMPMGTFSCTSIKSQTFSMMTSSPESDVIKQLHGFQENRAHYFPQYWSLDYNNSLVICTSGEMVCHIFL